MKIKSTALDSKKDYISLQKTIKKYPSYNSLFTGNAEKNLYKKSGFLKNKRNFLLAGVISLSTILPLNIFAQGRQKIDSNAVIYKIEDELDLDQKLINPKDTVYKNFLTEVDSIYNRKEFLTTWNKLPNSFKNLYEDAENQIASNYIKNGLIYKADSLGFDELKQALETKPNKNQNSMIFSLLKSVNECAKETDKQIFNPKNLSPKKYKLFVDINYIIKNGLVFGKNNKLVASRMPYNQENIKRIEQEFQVRYKDAIFTDYIYKTSYKNLITKFLHH